MGTAAALGARRPEPVASATAAGIGAGDPNPSAMRRGGLDISAELQLHTLRSGHAAACCSGCVRRLLPGELLHVYDSGRTLCALCSRAEAQAPIRSERIRTAVSRVAAVPRAA